ncbi:Pls/PosA family non-ribosomal peptide synthetase [Streptomyces sp. NPDC001407]|uniref:Pls/PosA family non-ribosomal peptide synthetase n=1 Tax=Streptomyces sp. NPDC001407 TaxID=3364573 RepID=UPI0036AF8A3D
MATYRPATGAARLHRVFEAACDRSPSATALECEQHRLTYGELDARANQLARHLRGLGIGPGARVAILVPRSVETYVSLLGVGKAGATFLPIDPAAPPARAGFITEDADVDLVLTAAGAAPAAEGIARRVLDLGSCGPELAAAPRTRLPPGREEDDPLAYIMYTSGSSGRPKGVRIAQSSICNFLRHVPELYDVRPEDRVHQGMTISFDFSIEEIWPTWAVGATLVAGPVGSAQFGAELADWLEERGITVLYCVPTLLATIPRDLPLLRAVMVGGEACPARLVERWSRPGRRILNTYGPTEATVTATVGELLPGRPVTIGRPLPTCSVVLLDEERQPVPDGEVGEICVGGPGVARGYIGRPELTADRFIEHPLAPAGGRLYRTGDLGRRTPDGQFEYLGRADAEVKVRGHRVDLGEIDNVLLEEPGVAEAATALMPAPDVEGGAAELSAYVVRSAGGTEADETLLARLHERARRRLPAYMVPSFLDVLTELPAMPSGKVDRRKLPPPTGRRLLGGGEVVPPRGELEEKVRDAWAEAFGVGPASLSAEADFFTDLGGHSLLAARVVSLLRDRGIGTPALRDLYAHPTVRGLAAVLGAPGGTAPPAGPPRPAPIRHSGGRIAAAGAVQAGALYLVLLSFTLPLVWVLDHGDGQLSLRNSLRAAAAVLISYLFLRWVVPAALARPLAAGIRPGRYRLWGRTYLRLWTLGLLLSLSPLPVLSGSPMMAAYLRLLGARVGPRTTIATNALSLPTLLRVGGDTAIGYGATLRPWRVADGWVTVAPIEIGPRCYVGANAVLEPGARMGAGSGLGEQSVIGQGEAIPPGARWAGSPPGPTDALSPEVEAMLRADGDAGRWRPRHLAAALLGLAALEAGMLAMIAPSLVLVWWSLLVWDTWAALLASLLSGPVYVLTVCCAVAVGKRLVLPAPPAGVRPLRSSLGVRKWLADKLLEFSLTFTNSLYATLYTVPWLRVLGARIGRGAEVSTAAHLDPGLLTLGDGSFVADMASIGAASFAAGRVSFGPTEVGRRAFVGNAACVPAGTRTGPGSLVGVGTVPPREEVPAGTSWLGSPAIHLPVRQSSGSFPEELTFTPTRKAVLQRLGIEFFRATMPASVLGTSLFLYVLALAGVVRLPGLLLPALVAPVLLMSAGVGVIAYCALVKRLVAGVYRPRVEPLWSLFVRRTEFVTGLFEAAAVPAGVAALTGTPFLPPVLRWFGARIGRRTWISTTYLTEFDLVDIGDDAAVGTGVSLQTHLFEDRVMKMSTVTLQAGTSIGTRAIVLYDGVVGEGVWLDALSLLMKGEHLTPGTSWRGIPAQGVAHRDAGREHAPGPRHR